MRIERAYSIVSSPYEESLEIFVELVRKGSLRISSTNKVDTRCGRKFAKGRFTRDSQRRTAPLLVSTVRDRTRLFSYVRTL